MRQLLINIAFRLNKLTSWIRNRQDRLAGNPVIDLEAYVADPFAVVETLREHGQILRTYSANGWTVLGYDEVRELMRQPQLSFSVEASPFGMALTRFMTNTESFPLIDEPWMLNQDPPDHTRLRKLSAIGFTHRFVEQQADNIRQTFEQLLSQAVSGSESVEQFDFASDIAQELPATVIANMLGVPVDDRDKFRHWSEELLCLLNPVEVDNLHRSAVASIELRQYLVQLVERKRLDKGEDLVSRLIEAEEDGDALTEEEIYSTCALLLVAGHETTSRLLSTGLYLLMKHPEQFALLRDGDVSIEQFIEETLRFEPPVLGLFRLVKEDFEMFDCQFEKGQTISFSIVGANRDPSCHSHPQEFDIGRSDSDHVSFGFGIHLCLGMALTRMEARIVFEGMLAAFSDIQLVREPSWSKHPIYRSPDELIVRCAA